MHECWTHVQELATAVSMGIDLTVLILNDNAYGMIKWKQVRLCERLICWLALKETLWSHGHTLFSEGHLHE